MSVLDLLKSETGISPCERECENDHYGEPRGLGQPAQPVRQISQEHLAGILPRDGRVAVLSVSPSGQAVIDMCLLIWRCHCPNRLPSTRGIHDRSDRRQTLLRNGRLLSLIYDVCRKLTLFCAMANLRLLEALG